MSADDIPTLYTLESIEQMRALADPLRLRILQLLAQESLTATEVGRQLGVPANKAHYHVRELERVGLVRQVETRERGGVLEKYFRAVAHDFTVPDRLLSGATSDEGLALIGNVLDTVVRDFQRGARRAIRQDQESRDLFSLTSSSLWLTRDEARALVKRIADLMDSYTHPRDLPGVREHTFALVAFAAPPAAEEERE